MDSGELLQQPDNIFFKVYGGGEEQTGGDEEAVKFDFIEFGFTH